MCSGSKTSRTGTDDMASEIIMAEVVSPRKARFCIECKEYFPVECFVGKDCTDDATVCNRHEPAKKGLRYCRGCTDFITLDLFKRPNTRFCLQKTSHSLWRR